MSKKDLIDAVAEATELSKDKAGVAVEAVIKHIDSSSRPSMLPSRRVRKAPAKPRRESPASTAQKISNTSGFCCPFMASCYRPGGALLYRANLS